MRKRYILIAVLVLLIVLVAIIFIRPHLATAPEASEEATTTGTSTLPEYTESTLAPYNGEDSTRPIYIAFEGNVYDVTPGKEFYGPGEIYHFLAGTDGTDVLKYIGGDIIKRKYTVVGTFRTEKLDSTTPPEGNDVGYVSGQVTIGPICPVVREGESCPIPPEVYTSRSVVVYDARGSTVKEKVPLDAEGKYSLTLPPDTYRIQIQPAGIGEGEKREVTVRSGETETVDFDIDTGIR